MGRKRIHKRIRKRTREAVLLLAAVVEAALLVVAVAGAILLLVAVAVAVLSAVVRQGDDTMPLAGGTVPSLRFLAALLAWLRRGE